MIDISSKINSVYSLEQLAGNETAIHRVHPLCKLLGAFIFIAAVVSFDRRALGGLLPFAFYPAVLAALSETPYSVLLKRSALVLPFCLLLGAANLFFETGAAFYIGSLAVSNGALSFCVIVCRALLCVSAALLLAATTRLSDLTAQLRLLKAPEIFIVTFEMTYRYIGILFGEAASMRIAYALRAGKTNGVEPKHAGSFIGSLMLRSFGRAERVYSAMKLRGYSLGVPARKINFPRPKDFIFLAVISVFCVSFRLINFGVLMERLFR